MRGMLKVLIEGAWSNGVRWVCTGVRCRWSDDMKRKEWRGRGLGQDRFEHTMALH